MPSKRDLILSEYGISKFRYRELYYFCLQYEEMVKEKENCYDLREKIMDGMPKAASKSDQTGNKAVRAVVLGERLKMIEDCAMESSGELYPWVLDAVITGRNYDEICPPCHEKKFRNMRRKFYQILNSRL
ncbi:MAG: hypothetical protein FWE24_11180 [Defluviitaleaceae bacterium]|nr:hypothetical protein [Defluviitaleaceae bacterium]